MSSEFNNLECLAKEELKVLSTALSASQRQQFQTAPLEEILDLLDEAAEVYKALHTSLPEALRLSAEQEIRFYTSLVRERSFQLPCSTLSKVQQVA